MSTRPPATAEHRTHRRADAIRENRATADPDRTPALPPDGSWVARAPSTFDARSSDRMVNLVDRHNEATPDSG